MARLNPTTYLRLRQCWCRTVRQEADTAGGLTSEAVLEALGARKFISETEVGRYCCCSLIRSQHMLLLPVLVVVLPARLMRLDAHSGHCIAVIPHAKKASTRLFTRNRAFTSESPAPSAPHAHSQTPRLHSSLSLPCF